MYIRMTHEGGLHEAQHRGVFTVTPIGGERLQTDAFKAFGEKKKNIAVRSVNGRGWAVAFFFFGLPCPETQRVGYEPVLKVVVRVRRCAGSSRPTCRSFALARSRGV